MSSPASFSSGSGPSPGCGQRGLNSRAVAVVTNRWYREQRRADQDATRMLTLLKQRKISCILKVESLHRGIVKEGEAETVRMTEVEAELEEIERKMTDLEKDREDRSKRIMDRRVLQVTTLQELGLLEKESKWRSESDLKPESPHLATARSSPGAASSGSSHCDLGLMEAALSQAGSEPSLGQRPDPSGRLGPAAGQARGLAAKLSPRLGRRNPLRMLSNAIDFRTRRKHRPKSADFENPEDCQSQGDTRSQTSSSGTLPLRVEERPGSGRSASVTDLLECVSLSPGKDIKGAAGELIKGAAKPRVLEGRNSAPDMLRPPGDSLGLQAVATLGARGNRARARLSAAASAKQKLSTRFQPQRKAQHQSQPRLTTSSSVKRAKTFSLGGPQGSSQVQTSFKTLPKQASSRSIGSTSTDSSQSSSSYEASSRKSSNSSNISDVSMASSSGAAEISQTALEEIAAFEKFITEYFENTDNNNTVIKQKHSQSAVAGRVARQKVSASSILSEVLELSI